MQTSQRGSVLLTIIGGIVILALLGMVAVSLMTGSVMTGLDAKETVQASYPVSYTHLTLPTKA